MKKKIIWTLLIVVSLFISCNTSDDSNTETNNFEVRRLISDAVNQNIIPSVTAFKTEALSLETQINNYLTTTTEANLELVKQQWIVTANAYESTYAYYFGLPRDQFLHESIYNWPTVGASIEFFISNNTEINQEIMDNISAQAKSMAAIEYFLFSDTATEITTQFLNSEKRRNYLRLSSAYLSSRANLLTSIWSSSGQDYGNTLINNTDAGIDGAFNLYFNGMFNALDVVKTTKVGKPSGLENSNVIIPDLTQSFYSETSLELIRRNIENIEEAYFNPSGIGVDDYVFSVLGNQDLNSTIREKFSSIYTSIEAINIPFKKLLETNPEEIIPLHQQLRDLSILFSVDVRSALSIIITTTDTDGD